MNEIEGSIYILTNPSFPEYVKIGYAKDVKTRVKGLNASSSTPFAFRIYATYDVLEELEDLKLHSIIDNLNPSLRSIDEIDGRKRIREFFAMTKGTAYGIFEAIAEISGTTDRLHLWVASKKEEAEEEIAEENRDLTWNRHNFKEIEFSCSLTKKTYVSKSNERGTLMIIDKETGEEVPNFSKPSKKQIVTQALMDLGEIVEKGQRDTLYQLIHRLEKIVDKKSKAISLI